MISRINPDQINPILGYKLDPGEPGLAHGAPASLSVLRVLSQEISNLVAFKNEAIRKGGYVVYSRISLNIQKKGAFFAAVAGRTEARIIYPSDDRFKLGKKGNENSEKIPYIEGNQNENNEEKANSINGENPEEKKARLEELVQQLEIMESTVDDPEEKRRIRQKIEEIRMELLMLQMGNYTLQTQETTLGLIFATWA